jgi:hypothetical protein
MNQMKFKTSGKLTEQFIGIYGIYLRLMKKSTSDRNMKLVGLGKHSDSDRCCPKIFPDIAMKL